MENILNLSNGVKVELVEGDKILILSESIKILLDNTGNLVYIENLARSKEEGTVKKVEKMQCDNMHNAVSKLLHDIGIPSNIKGYQYLRTAILLGYQDKKYLDGIVKNLYPKVAEIHDTTSVRTERAIRHAIQIAWDRGNTRILDELFAS